MKIDIDVDVIGDWLGHHPWAYLVGGGVAWHWIAAQIARLVFKYRPHWLGYEWYHQEEKAFAYVALSPFILPWLVIKTSLWLVTLGLVKAPWREFP